MNRFAQHMLRYLIDRAGGSAGQQTTILWMDVVAASFPSKTMGHLTQSAAGDVVYLRKAGFITMPQPFWDGEPPKSDPWVMTYSITRRGLEARTTEDLDPTPKSWRNLTPEERAAR